MHVGSCFWIPFGTLHLWDTDQHAIEVIPPAVYARKVQIPSETTFLDKILLIRQNLMLHQCRQRPHQVLPWPTTQQQSKGMSFSQPLSSRKGTQHQHTHNRTAASTAFNTLQTQPSSLHRLLSSASSICLSTLTLFLTHRTCQMDSPHRMGFSPSNAAEKKLTVVEYVDGCVQGVHLMFIHVPSNLFVVTSVSQQLLEKSSGLVTDILLSPQSVGWRRSRSLNLSDFI
ncbi:hypothetical protein BLNAU_23272 [Blattamonas nauphoetae]|uniref:Uncharacterized protein n=1 Tax=Blattamonas nauphoetae TaxID=2049346 RepID=A0ABQ9WTR9_9EUKA|nr:hypothetical protein BLNAU_23272 [Blattamonas nauphoetae]